MNGRLALSDPSVKELAKATCSSTHYDNLPELLGEANWQEWSDALQHAALLAGTDAVLNGESKHPISLEGQQCTTSEWNDNIKRTAVWRRRNESLLKAMRNASAVDLTAFDGSNAHQTYLGLKLQYHTSDSQKAFKLFSEGLMVIYELNSSPRDIADQLQDAFNRYNHLVGHNTEQRLPDNFLKMAFLDSLDSEYGDWRKTLLKERDVLALDEGSTLTFNELVNLTIAERDRLLQEQTNNKTSVPIISQRPPKRNISEVDEPAQQDVHNPCYRASAQDQGYSAQYSEIQNMHSNDNFSDDSESNDGSDPMAEDGAEEQFSTSNQHYASSGEQAGDDNPEYRATFDKNWQDLVVAQYDEVQGQIDAINRVLRRIGSSKRQRRKRGPVLEELSGKWLLYSEEYNPANAGALRFECWEITSRKQKRLHPTSLQSDQSTDSSGTSDSGESEGSDDDESDGEDNDDRNGDDESRSSDSSDDEERYDRVIRTDRHASVAIKVEENNNTERMRDAEGVVTAVAIKAEQSDSDESADEHIDSA
ncbi:unnamed protein product [Aureobasidium mustum]|uniref:Uncharacterized protein n=1 Tax=Aureobasidium mustum TaxID=2773714 RepID=A0A9N8PJP1_9PEZI|nr:unnamed protein product [Aureobasidium mustum]